MSTIVSFDLIRDFLCAENYAPSLSQLLFVTRDGKRSSRDVQSNGRREKARSVTRPMTRIVLFARLNMGWITDGLNIQQE